MRHDRVRSAPGVERSRDPAPPRLVPRGRGEPPAGQVSDRRDGPTRSRRSTPAEARLWAELERLTPIFLARWRAIRDDGGPLRRKDRAPPARALPRARLPHARATAISVRWNCRVDRVAGTKFGACKLAAGSRVSSLFPSYRRGAVLSRHARLGHDLLHLLQHAVRLLPERRHQHRQGQWRRDGPAHAGGDGLDAAPRGLPQHQLGRRRGRHSPAADRRRHRASRPRLHADAGGAGAGAARPRPIVSSGSTRRRRRRLYEGAFNAPMLWNSNFFMTLESMKILRC